MSASSGETEFLFCFRINRTTFFLLVVITIAIGIIYIPIPPTSQSYYCITLNNKMIELDMTLITATVATDSTAASQEKLQQVSSSISPTLPMGPSLASASRPTPRRVRFPDDDNSLQIVHSYPKDYTKKDEHKIWHTKDALHKIKIYNFAVMKSNHHEMDLACGVGDTHNTHTLESDDDDWTWRGFEYILHRVPRKQFRLEHTMGVIHFQRLLGGSSFDGRALADYASHSSAASGSLARAYLQAQQDAQVCWGGDQPKQSSGKTMAEDDDTPSVVSVSSSEQSLSSSCECSMDAASLDGTMSLDAPLAEALPQRPFLNTMGKVCRSIMSSSSS